jgi:N-acetylmuramoyl-L-alanine amidase
LNRSIWRLGAAVLLALISLTSTADTQGPAVSAGPSLTVLAREGRRTLPLTIISGQEFAGLDDLATAFELTVREESGAITVTYKGRTIILTPDQALASVSGRLVSLPAAPVRSDRRWLVPVEFASRALALIYDVRLDLRKPAHLLIVGDMRVPRLAARYEPSGSAGRLTVDATPRTASTMTQDGDRLTIRFEADAIDAPNPLIAPQPASSLVQSARATDATTVVVELGPRVAGVRSSSEQTDTATRLVIDLISLPAVTSDADAAAVDPPDLPPAFTPSSPAIRTIAVDAGHGGDDQGAVGAGGAKEKDLTLVIAERLKASIESRLGIRVLLTRDGDRSVRLDERTALANNNKADIFISLHANASLRETAAGATIFSASFAREAEEQMRAAGSPERLPTFGGGLRDIELVPWDLAQTRHLDQSMAFALILEQELKDRVPLASPAVEQAPLRILQSANMPAVLIEMGFVTNTGQEAALAGADFQAAFVQGIYDSIVRYRDAIAAGGTQ